MTAAPQQRADRTRGCLLGGAVGDALGAPIEFDSLARIRERFGPEGVKKYEAAYGRTGAVTDDTQMTLFTAEGLMRARTRMSVKGICHPPSVVDHAYARWLATQGETSARWDWGNDGWLVTDRELHARRAPGNTCLAALRASRMGTIDEPLNDSKGCGGVMRIAPAGLDRATTKLRERPRHEETLAALSAARALAASDVPRSVEAVETLGAGWVAEEALAARCTALLGSRRFG